MYFAQFCIIIPAVNEDGENKGSDEGLNSRRKQRWRDGEKTFASVRTVGGKAGTSKRAHRRGRSSGVTFTERPSMLNPSRQRVSIATIKKLCNGLDITLAEFFSSALLDELEQEIH